MTPTQPELTLAQQVELLMRGTEQVYTADQLEKRLQLAAKQKRPLRVKLGMDPTAPDLHLGHAVVLRKLRQFQDLGHVAVLIIGDATAMIGDPTGKKKTRPVLTPEEVKANATTYFNQAGRILDMAPGKVEIHYNSEWLHKMSFVDALQLCQKMTVARMLERDTFQQRHRAGEAIYIHEFMYPLMQGWDSVMIKADVELGGTDQTFNNLVGRDLQESEGQPPQIVIVMPILVGTDGEAKMSKSLNNYVGVSETPTEQFGKTMSIPDGAMPQWFKLCTPLPEDRITSLVDSTLTHPREAKEVLARSIVEQFHNAESAQSAADEFRRRFSEGQVPTEMETKIVAASNGHMVAMDLLVAIGFAASKGEARRLIEGGGVSFNNIKISDPKASLCLSDSPIVQVGKRRICRVQAG